MRQAAAPAYQRGIATMNFQGVAPVPRHLGSGPIRAPDGRRVQKGLSAIHQMASGGRDLAVQEIKRVTASREDFRRKNGLVQYGQSADLLSPAKLALSFMGFVAGGPVAAAYTAATLYAETRTVQLYWAHDRGGDIDENPYIGYVGPAATINQDMLQSSGFGYHRFTITHDDEAGEDLIWLQIPLERLPEMRSLFTQKRMAEEAEALINRRFYEGMPWTAESAAAVQNHRAISVNDIHNGPAIGV